MHHSCGTTHAQHALRQGGQHAAHGNQTVLLLVHPLDFNAQRLQALLQFYFEVVELEPRTLHQRCLLEENLSTRERHGVQKRWMVVVCLFLLVVQVLVAPIHEQHGIEWKSVRLLCLAHDPKRRLVSGREVALKLDELPGMSSSVENHLGVHALAISCTVNPTFERQDRAALFMRHALHGTRREHHALIQAPPEQLILECDAVHLCIRTVKADAVRVLVVDDHLCLGPDFVETV
mmetsp:Transcript_27793/g.69693  ORF Transcript_27793/g.69693 Transcript_27793/m.69693 type:complete len:234 (-) Transcript_27793:816-1517(-)